MPFPSRPPSRPRPLRARLGTRLIQQPASAGADPVVRQAKNGARAASTAAGSITLNAAPVSGNVLAFCLIGDKNTGALTLTGWNVVHSLPGTSVSIYTAWKVSDGTETTISFSTATAPGVDGDQFYVYELQQLGAGTWGLVDGASHPTDETTAVAWDTGTTGTLSRSGLALAFVGADSWATGTYAAPTWSNGYTHRYGATGTRPNGQTGLWTATLTAAGGATTTTTCTLQGTGVGADQMTGAVLVLSRLAAVDATVTPGTVQSTGAVGDPTVSAAQDAQATPGTVAVSAGISAPVTTGAGLATPATVSAATTVAAPTVTTGNAAAPSTVQATTVIGGTASVPILAGTVLGTTVIGGVGVVPIRPATVAAVAAIPASAVSTGAKPLPGTVAAVAAIPAPTILGAVGTVVHLWAGGATTSSIVVTPKLSGATSVRLKVSTAADLLTSPVFSSSVSPDANGYARLVCTGLTAGTNYYYQVESSGSLIGSVGRCRTAPSAASSFTFAVGSCSLDDVAPAAPGSWARAQARNPDLLVVTGDFPYIDIGTNDPAGIRSDREALLATTDVQAFVSQVATYYVWSDHDYGANNSDTNSASKTASQTVYRQQVPYPGTLPATDSINQTFTWGRVRFICTDERSYKSPVGNTDNSSKTMLGTTQKQWFKDTLTAATEPLIFWVGDTPWTGTTPDDDEWANYTTERTELGTFITALSPRKQIIRIAGDMHALAADNGSGSVGGIPVIQSAPWRNNASIKGEPYSQGIYPASGTTMVEQYGIVAITDTGTSIIAAFTGYDSTDVARITLTVTTAQVAAATVAGAAAIGAPTVGQGALVTASTVAAATTIGGVAKTGSKAAPGTVAATAAVTGPALRISHTAQPGTVAALTGVPQPAAGLERIISAGNSLTGTVTGLTAGAAYIVRVRAVDAAGNRSAWSAPLELLTAGGSAASPATVAGSSTIGGAGQAGTTAAPSTVAALAAVGAPVIRQGTTPAPATVSAVAAVGAAQVTTGNVPVPPTVQAVTTIGATVTAAALATPGTVAAVAAVGATTVRLSAAITATTVAGVAAVGTAAPSGTGLATPPTVSAVAAVSAAQVTTGNVPVPPTVAAVASIGAPTVAAGAKPLPGTVAGSTTIGAVPTASSTPTPTTVAATTSVGSPAVAVKPTPDTVQATTVIPGPAVGGSTIAAPGTVAAVTTIGATVVRGSVAVTPATVAALATVAATTVLTSARVTPATVAGTVTIGGSAFVPATVAPATVPGVTAVGSPAVHLGAQPAPATVAGRAAVAQPIVTIKIIPRPFAGTTARPSTGRTGRPFSGITVRP